MPEIEIYQEKPTLGVDYFLLNFPDDKKNGSGTCEFFIQPDVLSRITLTTISIFNEPVFAIRVDLNSITREVILLIGPANGIIPDISVFKLPNEFNLSRAVKFLVKFIDWHVNSVEANEYQLEEFPILIQMDNPSQRIIQIAPMFEGRIAPRDLIEAIGNVILKLEFIGAGLLFRVTYDNYLLEAGFTEESFYIARNDRRIELPVIIGLVTCIIQWRPTQLGLYISSNDRPITQEDIVTQDTPPTFPPNSIIDWFRKQAIEAEAIYNSKSEFYQVVTNSMLSIPDKVLSLSLQDSFWDKTYDGKKIVSKHPKSEPDIQPMIHGLLHDICLAKNIQVLREPIIAGGQLDFLFTGSLITHEMINVCAEFKHAHSDDISHGLLIQLPAYMQAKGCDFGLYCVMYFKDTDFQEPARFIDQTALHVFLDCERLSAGLSNIRIICIDFSHQKPPSKK